MNEVKPLIIAVAKRFLRAFFAGAVAGAATVAVASTPSSLQELSTWLFAIVIGAVTGGLLALDKLVRYQ